MAAEYFVDPDTGAITLGKQRSWQHRMGPYASREEAERALATARERTREWDEQDRVWAGETDTPDE